MKKQTIASGYLLILAALGFWISWFLMPDPGTTDTRHILSIVKASRTEVMSSVIVQIITSVIYMAALFLLARISFPQGKSMTGLILLGVGTMGLCADAFFHLLAWYMTDPSVTIQQDVVQVMNFMQTDALVFLVPLLLPFFAGSIILAVGLNKQEMISRKAQSLFIAAILAGVVCGLIAAATGYDGPALILTILGLFATGQAIIGWELINSYKQETVMLHVWASKNK